MKPVYPSKSSFDKLYLIEEEMYNRIFPKLNEVEKQELKDLNEINKPYQDFEEVILDENSQTLSKPQTTEETIEPENNKDQLTTSSNNTIHLPATTTKKSIRKEKKFACDICINKMFTTKHSLKRHHKTFHMPKQFIKQSEEPEEVISSDLNSPAKKPILKRRFSSNDNSPSEEPIQKQVKFDLKRKFSDDYNSVGEEPVQKSMKFSQGVKRKSPNNTNDYSPKKRFHWTSF